MKRQFKTRPLVFLLLFLSIVGWTAAANVWGYDTPGVDLKLYTDPSQPDVTYELGVEAVPLIVVQRNVAFAEVLTTRGFSERELHQSLIITDPTGRRHYLNAGAPVHRMPIPFFIANRAWGKAEILPEGWERSVQVKDLRNHIAEMNNVAGWYTIQAQQPFVRYATLREDASLGDLGDLTDPANWKGTLNSNVLQVYVAPAAGAQLKTQVKKLENDVETPLPQVTVRVFEGASVPTGTELAALWTTQTPVLTGTTNFEGAVVWAAASVCLTRGDYLVVAHYGGEYEGQAVKRDDDTGWGVECQGMIDKTILFTAEAPLPPGDLSGDGVVDAADYSVFLGTFGKCLGAAGFVPEADFDQDGCITYSDYGIWYGYYLNQ
jgi:hypothetical protein